MHDTFDWYPVPYYVLGVIVILFLLGYAWAGWSVLRGNRTR